MAGGILFKSNPKKQAINNESNNEILKDSAGNKSADTNKEKAFVKYFLEQLQKEQQLIYDRKQMDVRKEIEALQQEIKNLKNTTEALDMEVEKAIDSNIFEFNEYQVGFLERIRKIIIEFRKDINQAGNWLECFNGKKRKKNCFWNNVKSKKGGEQYLQSGEHSASRSAN
jgi:uncharacterized coiled-coil DUF342 family protein